LLSGPSVWVQLISGAISLNGNLLTVGDGAAIEDVESIKAESLKIEATQKSEFLLFDLRKN
jgi:redox-sensitive bicupin YhaK (pirin superfamily)